MTEPSEAAKRRACELLGASGVRGFMDWKSPPVMALARYIETTSDAARVVDRALATAGRHTASLMRRTLQPLILPDEPDPLPEIIGAMWEKSFNNLEGDAKWLRTELAKRGLKIVASKK